MVLLKIWTCLPFLTFFVITTKELKPYVKPLCSENSHLETSLMKWDRDSVSCPMQDSVRGTLLLCPVPNHQLGFALSSFYHLYENQKLFFFTFCFRLLSKFWAGTYLYQEKHYIILIVKNGGCPCSFLKATLSLTTNNRRTNKNFRF